MINKNKYNEIIHCMKEIDNHHSDCKFKHDIQEIQGTINDFDIKLMFVGHFNAGKSALINALIGKTEFLKEAQKPQTAIATELIFDDNEIKIAYTFDGRKEKIEDGKIYDPNKYHHVEYRLNVEPLKKVRDFTIVDTPGFDAGIEAHAKALANYIGLGSGYMVVIDQEKGGIDKTTLDFLIEISNYSSQVAILINKCDKITKENTEYIAESARNTLELYGLPYNVYTVSKKDEDISNNLISIISEFDAQKAFDKRIKKQLNAELINMLKILSIKEQKLYLDTFDLDSEINAYNRTQRQLTDSFKSAKESELNNIENTTEGVISAIRSSLVSNSDSISEAILDGNKVAAEAMIVEVIRPIMIKSMKEIGYKQIDNVTRSLDFSGLSSKDEGEALSDIAINLANNLKTLIDQGAFDTKKTDKSKKEKTAKIYRTITAIGAITTNVVAPWIEIVIILLPDIINLLHGLFGESDEEICKRKFINHVIPQIINKLYPNISENIKTTTENILGEYESQLNEQIEVIKNNITDAETKKKEKTAQYKEYRELLSKDILTIQGLVDDLEGE